MTRDVMLDTVLDESRFQWTAGQSPRTAVCGGTRIEAEIVDDGVVFRTRLLRLPAGRPPAITDALAGLIAMLNDRLRSARVTGRERDIALEAVVPAAALNSSAVNHAVEALGACAALAKGACAALNSEQVANWFLAFHKSQIAKHGSTGGDSYADTHP